MTETRTLETVAKEFAEAFEARERNEPNEYGDKTFYTLKNGSPKWMTDAIHKAHGDIMPNDWIYEQCSRVADRMAEYRPETWDDSMSEWADSLVDVYNGARARWLASNLAFGEMVDEAVEAMGHSDQGIYGDIGIGQYVMIERIASALIQAVRDQLECESD